MDNKDNKKKRKKKADQTTPDPSYSGGEKEHKVPWQEKYASPDEIEKFLNDHIYLRRNVVTMRTEWREPSSYKDDGTEDWQPMSDWKLNSLWKEMMKEKPVIFEHMRMIVTGTGVWVYPDACPNDYRITSKRSPSSIPA